MKKALLLSVVASVAVMAGGDIAPAPVVEEVSAWDFSGQAVLYYQTLDNKDFLGTGDPALFDQTSSMADFGLQLRAVNKDVFWGIGFGGEVSGLATLNLENWMVSNVMQGTGGTDPLTGGFKSFQKHFLHLHSLKTGTYSETHSMQRLSLTLTFPTQLWLVHGFMVVTIMVLVQELICQISIASMMKTVFIC